MKDSKKKLPEFTVKVTNKPTWFTKALDRIEKGQAPFKSKK